jgi:hypothetical protein
VGTGDLLYAFYSGARVRLDPGSLGVAFYIVTAIVPPLLVTHALVFVLLIVDEMAQMAPSGKLQF